MARTTGLVALNIGLAVRPPGDGPLVAELVASSVEHADRRCALARVTHACRWKQFRRLHVISRKSPEHAPHFRPRCRRWLPTSPRSPAFHACGSIPFWATYATSAARSIVAAPEGPNVEGCRGAALSKSVRNNFRTCSGIVTRTATLQSKWPSPRLGSPSEPQRLLARGLRACPGANPARRSSLRCACRRAMPRLCERRQSTAGSASQN